MITFREYINEGTPAMSKEIEQYMLKMDPKKFIKQAQNIKDKAWYWANKPNLNTYLEQNGYDNSSYTKGSIVDLLRNYSYGNEMMSKKMKDHIDKALSLKDYTIPKFDKTYTFEQDGEKHTFRVWFDDIDKMKRIIDKEAAKSLESTHPSINISEIVDSFFNYGYIKGQIDGKGTFSFSTYRNRKKLSPATVISKKDLYQDIADSLKPLNEHIFEDAKWRDLVTQVMVDKVIGDHYIVDNSELINKIKDELHKCKTSDDAVDVLNRYGFKDIPGSDIVEKLISSKDFSYSESTPDRHGHQNVTVWKINFEKRIIKQTFGNSSD